MTGPGGGAAEGICANADFNESGTLETNQPDGDVDMADLLQLQLACTGYDIGACCHLDGTCTVTASVACGNEFGAAYQGSGTTCPSTRTPQLVGACCTNGVCTVTTAANCAGLYFGANTSCPATCPAIIYQDTADLGYTPSGQGKKIADDFEAIQAAGLLSFVKIGVKGGGGGPFNVQFEVWTGPPCSGGAPIPGTSCIWSGVPDGGPQYLTHVFDTPIQLPSGIKAWGVWTFSTPQAGCVVAGVAQVGYTYNAFGMYVYNANQGWHWECNFWLGGNPWAGFWTILGVADWGACCTYEGYCSEGTLQSCASPGGYFRGNGTTCAATNCNDPSRGACCISDDAYCTITLQENCHAMNGTWRGVGTMCNSGGCNNAYRNVADPLPGYVSRGANYTWIADDLTRAAGSPSKLSHLSLLAYGPAGSGTYSVTAGLSSTCGGSLISGTSFTWNNVPADGYVYLLQADIPSNRPTIPSTVWIVVSTSTPASGVVGAGQAEVGSTANVYGKGPPVDCAATFGPSAWAGFYVQLETTYFIPTEEEIGSPVLSVTQTLLPSLTDFSLSEAVTLTLGSPQQSLRVLPGSTVIWRIAACGATGGGLAGFMVDLEQDSGNPQFFDVPPGSVVPGMEVFNRPGGICNPGVLAFGGTPMGTAGARNLVQIGGAQNTFGLAGEDAGTGTTVYPGIGQGCPTMVEGSFAAPQTPGLYRFNLTKAAANVLRAVTPPQPPDPWPVLPAAVTLASPLTFTVCYSASCTKGDVNQDGAVNGRDIQPFVLRILQVGPNPISGSICTADMNNDCAVNNGDIPCFVQKLLTGGSSCGTLEVSMSDCNLNGIPDPTDIADLTSTDCNNNFIPDECDINANDPDGNGLVSTDIDGNGVPDECQNDCDHSGVPDSWEIAQGTRADINANGIPDICEPDCNHNGLPDNYDISQHSSADCNSNGTPDECEADCNGNHVPDDCDLASGYSADCDADGFPDECELAYGPMIHVFDCNDNGVPDNCDIASGYSNDSNHNGIPDECEGGGQIASPAGGGGSSPHRKPSASAGLDGGGESGGNPVDTAQGGSNENTGETPMPPDTRETPGPQDTDAAWEAFYEWADAQCWGLDCETTGSEQFQAYVDKLAELGLPVEGPGAGP